MGKNSLTVGMLGQASAGILLEAMTLEGWTQREASERTGITRTRLMSILNAEKPATIDEIDMIAVALGRKASDVVAEAEAKNAELIDASRTKIVSIDDRRIETRYRDVPAAALDPGYDPGMEDEQ